MSQRITVALAGNPNSGKTTIFNSLTGARQHVGNYPGVTVEKKEGACTHGETVMEVVDLPGTYSLTAYSVEEIIARNFVIDERPDVVVDIIDSSNLERNLYLAVQLMELRVPLVLAFNMSDIAKARGTRFDLEQLSSLLGAPIVRTVGHKNVGREELLDTVVRVATGRDTHTPAEIHYGDEIENEIAKIGRWLVEAGAAAGGPDARWLALKLLENDTDIKQKVGSGELLELVEKSSAHLQSVLGDPPEILIADRRYGFISGACQEAVRSTVETRHTRSDRIDAVLTNRAFGLPIFAALMYLVFHLTFVLGDPLVGLLDGLIKEDLGGSVARLWPKGSESLLKSLLVDGVISGVGGVIVFVPLIMLLFLAIAILEDSGYMARAAFIMDRLMHKIGLHGKSFIPMLIGFGCTVPAIMATRTLESRRDRLTTMLIAPLMSCGARLPIYTLIIPAFFPRAWQTPMLWLIYVIGIVLAIMCAKLLRSTLLPGESTPFVMELPPYRLPTLKGVVIHMWERGWLYLRKAGTVIFAFSVVLWAANTFPRKTTFGEDYQKAAQRAASVCVRDTKRLSAALGLPARSTLIQQAVQAELTLARRREKYWQGEKEYEEAERQYSAAVGALKQADGGAVLAVFLAAREQVAGAREAFDWAVAALELEEAAGAGDVDVADRLRHSPQYKELVESHRQRLSEIQRANPRAYAAALTYLGEIKATFDETITDLGGRKKAEEMAYSISGRTGRAMAPALKPLGLGDWRIATALIGALGAKEVFVSQMGIVYSLGEEIGERSGSLREKLRSDYSRLQAFCIMLFCLISAPCMATIAITRSESNSWRWPLLQLVGLTALAYVVTAAVFQIGSVLS